MAMQTGHLVRCLHYLVIVSILTVRCISVCIFVERFMGLVAGPAFTVVTTSSIVVYLCCFFAIVLCEVMKRHAIFLRRSPETSWNWHSVTERNAESTFIATSALLAAPIAWRNWSVFLDRSTRRAIPA